MKPIFPEAMLKDHLALVAKTGRGKTSTGKLIVEQVVAEGHRVCILDPIKSDWWGITSSADGKRAGLPFDILGGPHGHVPLHDNAGKAIAEVVANGSLKLSIIDMAKFKMGGQQKFFADFASTLLSQVEGILYLVVEEAHMFAPKERVGFGAENMALHYAKQIATAGRSKGLRAMFLTQRVQKLHNDLLGSCETLIAMGLTAPADQKPVIDWLKGNVRSKDLQVEIAESLSSLSKGEGWICCGELGLFERKQFPRIKTYDNTATPTTDGRRAAVHTAPVDQDKLRAMIGAAVAEAEANDPKLLREQIARLNKQLSAKSPKAAPAPTVKGASKEDIAAAVDRAIVVERRKFRALASKFERAIGAATGKVDEALQTIRTATNNHMAGLGDEPAEGARISTTAYLQRVRAEHDPSDAVVAGRAPLRIAPPQKPTMTVNGSLDGPRQRIIDSLAWWEAIGIPTPDRIQVAAIARYNPSSGSFKNPIGSLRSMGLVEYPTAGSVQLTDDGRVLANAPETPPTQEELHARIMGILDGPKQRILQPLLDAYPDPMPREEVAAAANYDPASGSFKNPIGALRSLGLIDYPSPGQAVALPVNFVGS